MVAAALLCRWDCYEACVGSVWQFEWFLSCRISQNVNGKREPWAVGREAPGNVTGPAAYQLFASILVTRSVSEGYVPRSRFGLPLR